MRVVEALSNNIQGPAITLDVARARLAAINQLRDVLERTPKDSVDSVLYDHAAGTLADAAAHTALAPSDVIGNAEIRRDLTAALVFGANTDYPQFDAAIEENFQEDLAWGGPSARTSAARGLMCLVRADTAADADMLADIHRLARDPVCHVRLQIIENIYLLHQIQPEWMWSELEYVVLHESTRGVVNAALEAAGRIAWLDIPRVISLSKSVLSRYAQQSGAGVENCRATASSLIADLYIWTDNEDAKEFVLQKTNDFLSNSKLLPHWITRFSGNLLIGSTTDASDNRHLVREKTIRFYKAILDASFAEAERISTELDISNFESWQEQSRETLREMFQVMDEITLRLYFAAGADDPSRGMVVTAERIRFYREVRPLLEKLSDVMAVHVAHYLVQTLESLIPIDPSGVFELIARSVKASEKGGYTMESMAADVIVRIVERYLADHREVFVDHAALSDLMDCLDAFVRAGWASAQAITFRLGEIWR
jgi:hypothetical protein